MWRKKRELAELHQHLKTSFSAVKQDTQNIFQWIQHLHQKNREQEQLLSQFSQKIQQQEQLFRHFQSPPPNYNDRHYTHLHQRVEHLSQKVDALLARHQQHSQKLDAHNQTLDHFHQKLQALEAQKTKPKASFKERVIQTLSHHSKNYLKNLIFQYLEQHQNISAFQLKDIIVNQQGLASKSTFYRLLSEIEKSPQVTVVRDGKQKYFLLKTAYS